MDGGAARQEVGYELGAERKDRYGRTLAYLYRGEKMHDLDLLRGGYAKVLTMCQAIRAGTPPKPTRP